MALTLVADEVVNSQLLPVELRKQIETGYDSIWVLYGIGNKVCRYIRWGNIT